MTAAFIPMTVEHAALIAQASIDHGELITRAKEKYCFQWWETNDPYILVPAQLREPVLLVEFSRLHEATELVLGRDVRAEEFIYRDKLLEEFSALAKGND